MSKNDFIKLHFVIRQHYNDEAQIFWKKKISKKKTIITGTRLGHRDPQLEGHCLQFNSAAAIQKFSNFDQGVLIIILSYALQIM